MQLIRYPISHQIQSVITIGNFDGCHLGHQTLLHQLMNDAKTLNLSSVVLTFEPYPSEFFLKEPVARLMRFSEKWRAIQSFHIDYFYCMKFNSVLAKMSPEDFVKNILVDQLGVKKLIIGDDFRFGAKRIGDVNLLITLGKQYHFEVEAIASIKDQADRISSSRIRNALENGDFKTVYELTGRPFMLSGKVSYGQQIGRQLGFPTANIHLHRKKVPLMGIFIVKVHGLSKDPLKGVASVGYRPTFFGKEVILEVFILDFDQEIYGEFIEVEFIQKIRDELFFESVDDLVVQMKKDVEIAKKYFLLDSC